MKTQLISMAAGFIAGSLGAFLAFYVTGVLSKRRHH